MATERTGWTDERLDELRTEVRELRMHMDERFDQTHQSLDRLRDVLLIAAFSMIGVLIAALVALVIAVA